MTALFWVLAAGLAAIGIGFLAWPLLRAAPPTRLDRRAATLAAHRARLAEIDAGDEGSAEDAATGREARDDVARSLLRDLDPEDRPAAGSSGDSTGPDGALPRRGAAIALGIAVPLLAAGIYVLFGEPRGLDQAAARNAGQRADALALAVAQLLAEAEALARANGDRLEGEPARLIEQALVSRPTTARRSGSRPSRPCTRTVPKTRAPDWAGCGSSVPWRTRRPGCSTGS